MTVAELQTELDKVNAMRGELAARARDLAAKLNAAQAEEAAKARVAAMSPAERAALAAEISAVGNAA
jgi:uncharacterized protein YlxW (UPF0749 family)